MLQQQHNKMPCMTELTYDKVNRFFNVEISMTEALSCDRKA